MKIKILLIAMLTIPGATLAGVSPQNGSFYITYSDIVLSAASHELTLSRTYNSLSTGTGWFGFGWGSRFETRLVVMPDGTAVVHETGNGQINYYRPTGKIDVAAGTEQIVQLVTQRDKLTPDAAETLRKQLTADEELRMRKVRDYGMHNELAVGAMLASDQCDGAMLSRTADNYRRKNCDGGDDYFDLQGRMVRHEDDDGYVINANYDGARPQAISDTQGNVLKFVWTPAGRLQDATTNGNHHLIYSYDGKNNLVKSNDVNGNAYKYDYDENHNMTRVTYIDDSTMRITYVSPESGRASSVTERSGDKWDYEYRVDPADSQHTWTKIIATSSSGRQSMREYEFHRQRTQTGEERLSAVAIADGGDRRQTGYDSKGRVVRKVSGAGDVIEFVYHPHNDKLILVMSKGLTTTFHYDENGQLTSARNSVGQRIDLDYGATGSIQRMVETSSREKVRRELLFKYDNNEKPVEISLTGVGKIVVEYDEKGEIRHVSSDQNQDIALQVTAVFKNLLEVVRVAGVRFSM